MAAYIPKEPPGKKAPVVPAERNGIHYGTFTFTDPAYPGKTLNAFYSKDTANGDFLQVYKITFGPAPWDYTVPTKSDFTKLMRKDGPGQIAYYDAVGRLKNTVENQNKGNNAQLPGGATLAQIDEALKASQKSSKIDMPGVWKAANKTKAADPPAAAVPPAAPDETPVSDPPPAGLPVALPDEIKALQETADKTIESLNPPGRNAPVILQYPAEGSFDNSQDYVLIEQFTYRAPQENLFLSGASSTGQPGQQSPQFTTSPINIIAKGLTRNTNLRDYIGMVKLPIPNQLGMSDGVNWGEDRANPVEAAAFFGALPTAQSAIGGNFAGAVGNIFSGFGSFIDEISRGGLGGNKPAGLLLSSFIAQYMLGKVGINVDPAQFIARGTGTTINPNLELLFNGPKLRTFAFSFEFAPTDEFDAIATRRVIRFFKQGMAPKRVSTNTIFIGSPNVFRVSYRTEGGNNIKGLNRHKICALTTCEVNYTPDGMYQSYKDPWAGAQPVRTTMTLTFTELTPIFESDYYETPSPDADPSIIDAFNPLQDENGNTVTSFDPITYHDIGF